MAGNGKASTETGRWHGHIFKVSPKLIRGFSGLQIKGSCETVDKVKDGQLYVVKKNSRPAEATLTVHLNAFTGCDVRKEADAFVAEAQGGWKDYFYIGTKKLLPCRLLLTDATVKEIQIAHSNTWVSADVQLTFRQTGTGGVSVAGSSGSGSGGGSSGAYGGGGGGSGGTYSSSGSSKASVKATSPVEVGATIGGALLGKAGAVAGAGIGAAAGAIGSAVKNALTGGTSTGQKAASVAAANNSISRITSGAKSYSATKKTAGQVRGCVRNDPDNYTF